MFTLSPFSRGVEYLLVISIPPSCLSKTWTVFTHDIERTRERTRLCTHHHHYAHLFVLICVAEPASFESASLSLFLCVVVVVSGVLAGESETMSRDTLLLWWSWSLEIPLFVRASGKCFLELKCVGGFLDVEAEK